MHPCCTLRDFHKKKGLGKSPKPLILLVRQAGFEPATYGFVVGIRSKNIGNKQ